MGARLGNRRRRRDGGIPDGEGARREGRLHVVERREARTCQRARGRRNRQPRVGRRQSRGAREATGGHGVDVVVEHVGEATWRTSLDVATQRGRIVVCGATTGPNPPAALHRIWWKELAILGSSMGSTEDFEGCLRPRRVGPSSSDRGRGLPARRRPRRTRAPRGRRAAREDRTFDPRLACSSQSRG